LLGLIGEDYLAQNPPTGSGIPECDPSDTSLIVDSELYFLLLLMHIEENGWNVIDGLIEALSDLIVNNAQAYMNFILCDGESVWGFCGGLSLYYLDDSLAGYRALASAYPPSLQGNWVQLNDYELVFFNAVDSLTVLDIRFFLPPDFYIAGDSNGDLKFNDLDITYSVNYLKEIGPAPPDTVDCPPNGLLMAAADVNGSCAFNGLDVIYSVAYFRGIGPAPMPCADCPPNGVAAQINIGKPDFTE